MELRPKSKNRDHIIDFQIEILHNLNSNIDIIYGPKKDVLTGHEIEDIKHDIATVWYKYKCLIRKIRICRRFILVSLLIILVLIAPNIVAYILFIDSNLDSQNNHSCSLFSLIYELCIFFFIGWPLMCLRLKMYYNSLIEKWKNGFLNHLVILINNKLMMQYLSKQWLFEIIYPVEIHNACVENWCFLRIKANNDDYSYSEYDAKQPIYATRYCVYCLFFVDNIVLKLGAI